MAHLRGGRRRAEDRPDPAFDLIKCISYRPMEALPIPGLPPASKFLEKDIIRIVSPLQPGDLVEVAVGGDYVTQFGVYWEDCDTEFCHLAQMIDTTLILDDKGTGLTNGFIRYGWEPPSHPMYGFLCWQIRPYTDKRVAEQAGGLQ